MPPAPGLLQAQREGSHDKPTKVSIREGQSLQMAMYDETHGCYSDTPNTLRLEAAWSYMEASECLVLSAEWEP